MSKEKTFNLIGETPVYLVRKGKSFSELFVGCMGVFPLGEMKNVTISNSEATKLHHPERCFTLHQQCKSNRKAVYSNRAYQPLALAPC